VEFAFDAASIRSVTASSGTKESAGGVVYLHGIEPGVDSFINLVSKQGRALHIVVLTAQQAEDAWKVHLHGQEHLLITRQDFFADNTLQPEQIYLRSRSNPGFEFTVTPPVAGPIEGSLHVAQTASTRYATTYAAQAQVQDVKLACREVRLAGVAPPVKIGKPFGSRPGVAEAPPESKLPEAAEWSITIPPDALRGLSNLYLQIRYQGDVARLYSGNRLLTDNFYSGKPWTVGLRRFLGDDGAGTKLTLNILPLRKDAPVYFELPAPIHFPGDGQVSRLGEVRLVPEYQLEMGSTAP
jgi:beta-galactosidase